MPRPVIAALYVAFVLLCALVLRWRGGATWRQFFIGAAVMFVASLVGGLASVVVRFVVIFVVAFGFALFTSHVPALLRTDAPLLILLLVVAASEEVGRCAFLWRNRQMPVWHAAMFGVGFGGAELVFRAGNILLAAAAPATLLVALGAAMIFVFHIALTVIVNRQYVQGARFAVILTVAACYHVGLDFVGGRLWIADLTLHAAIFWTAMTPVHLAVAWRLCRQGDRAPVPPLLR